MNGSRILAVCLLAASLAAHAGERCDMAREADFAGDGRHRLEAYLESLARASGESYGIRPQEFQLLVSSASPPIIGGRWSEGDIGCSWGKRYISLFKRALTNRPLAETYNTIARQYFHHVQVRRDGVRCDSSVNGVTQLQAEARDWAQKIAPLCP